MTTLAQIHDADRCMKVHLVSMMKLAKLNESVARPGDLDLARKLLAVSDGNTLGKVLGRKDVDDLFRRGVIYFGEAK